MIVVSVYFIATKTMSHVKIGQTTSLPNRFRELANSQPTTDALVLLFAVEAPRALEQYFHDKWKKFRTHGEWFVLDESIIKWIESAKEDLGHLLAELSSDKEVDLSQCRYCLVTRPKRYKPKHHRWCPDYPTGRR